MQNLLKIITNDKNYERKETKAKKFHKSYYKSDSPRECRRKRIAYKINGYWFYFDREGWANFTGLPLTTIVGRIKSSKPVGQILGYEELPSGITKRGRPRGVKNK